jgi:hypothetical protein
VVAYNCHSGGSFALIMSLLVCRILVSVSISFFGLLTIIVCLTVHGSWVHGWFARFKIF